MSTGESTRQGPLDQPTRKQTRARLSNLDAHILALEKDLAMALRQRQILQTELDNLYRYPILDLPTEIISEIFIQFLPTAPNRPLPHGFRSPALLTQLCRSWRNIALATPSLWSALYLKLRNPSSFQTWLARSRDLSLSISLDTGSEYMESPFQPEQLTPFVDELASHSLRWRGIQLFMPVVNLGLKQRQFPLLYTLVLGPPDGEDGDDDEAIILLDYAPLLQPLSLSHDFDPDLYILPWSQITTLSVTMLSAYECARILAKTASLMHFTASLDDDDEPLSSVTPLLHLQELVLRESATAPSLNQQLFLDKLTTPALRHLRISERNFYHCDPRPQILSLLLRSQPPLAHCM
ncbi:hypothetical protein B0H11DRAFT_740370 [Mycena galericulata]|nr:hypothetical protein B0H11DRAFT_740370 [Mycena galericulata]